MSDSLVIIPTYNERENIERMLKTVFALPQPFHVLVVDDGSPDGTAQIVKDQTEFGKSLFILERSGKLGLGTAYLAGFSWGLERDYEYLFEMDADFSHSPPDLIRLREACHEGGADLAVGSRYTKGGRVENWPADRVFLSKGASFYVRMITWMPVMDPTAGFICYTRKVLETLDFSKIKAKGYAFQIEMKYAARQMGFKIVEVPITFTDRIAGQSKMSSNIITEAITSVLKLRWRGMFQSYEK